MNVIDALRHALIVSCQAEVGFPLNAPDHLAAMASTAVIGGARGIRASNPDNIRAIRRAVDVPLIGIYKKDYPGFDVRITPTMAEAVEVAEAGSDIIALDATQRNRPDGVPLGPFIRQLRERFNRPVLADVSNFEEGVEAAALGADLVATTLSGYTAESLQQRGPDLALVERLVARLQVPVIAEGRIGTPGEVFAALEAGAYAVVVGSMITRPHLITQRFVAAVDAFARRQPVVAVDIGGTKIAGAIVDRDSNLLVHQQMPSEREAGGAAIVQRVLHVINRLQREYGGPLNGVGIATGGQVDQEGNIVGGTDMIPDWSGQPLRSSVEAQTGLPVAVLNDGHAAALAEACYGVGRDFPSLLCVVIGTGLGGGVVFNRRLLPGAHGLAGSIGQIKILREGADFVPLEQIVSGPGLVQIYNEKASRLATSGEEVARRARAGEPLAREAARSLGQWLGLGLSYALHLCDASCVVVGGSVAGLGDLLLDPAREALAAHGHASVAQTPILPAQFGPQAGLVGAAWYAWQQLDTVAVGGSQ